MDPDPFGQKRDLKNKEVDPPYLLVNGLGTERTPGGKWHRAACICFCVQIQMAG